MSTAKSADAKFLEGIPGLTPDVLRISRIEWGKSPVMRDVIAILAKDKIEELRTTLEACSKDDIDRIQGGISAIREFLAMIDAQAKK